MASRHAVLKKGEMGHQEVNFKAKQRRRMWQYADSLHARLWIECGSTPIRYTLDWIVTVEKLNKRLHGMKSELRVNVAAN